MEARITIPFQFLIINLIKEEKILCATMDEYEGIKVVHTYKGKKVTHTFFKNNKHLFTEPAPYSFESAIDLLKRMKRNTKKYSIYIDESGKISFTDPG